MLLVADVGNTNLVLGLFDGERLARTWRFSADRNRTADELRLLLAGALREADIDPASLSGAAIASVVPSLNLPLERALSALGADVAFLAPETSPIPLAVDEPHSVGADRIANCIAAHDAVEGAALVLDFGTAITFDLVDASGAFLGGAIAPEMQLAGRALTERAAQLFSTELVIPETVIGKTTAANIRAGVVLGYLDLVEGLVARFKDECAEPLSVIATGGKGKLFYEHCDSIQVYDSDLTLRGLMRWWVKWVSG